MESVKRNSIVYKSKSAYLGVTMSLIFFVDFLIQKTLFTAYFYVMMPFLIIIPLLFDFHKFQFDDSFVLFSPEEVPISNIKRIGIMNIYGYVPFRPYNLDIEAKNGDFVRPLLAFARNGHELTKILILKVRDANPNVEIDPVLLKKYGFQ